MRAQELRVGNYVDTPVGVKRVVSIVSSADGSIYDMEYEVFPIPLTEELLLKLGFTKELSQFNDYDYTFFPLTVFFDRGNYVFKFQYLSKGMGGSFTKVETLHHLQNLYFALTGEELEVNLD